MHSLGLNGRRIGQQWLSDGCSSTTTTTLLTTQPSTVEARTSLIVLRIVQCGRVLTILEVIRLDQRVETEQNRMVLGHARRRAADCLAVVAARHAMSVAGLLQNRNGEIIWQRDKKIM